MLPVQVVLAVQGIGLTEIGGGGLNLFKHQKKRIEKQHPIKIVMNYSSIFLGSDQYDTGFCENSPWPSLTPQGISS